MTTIENQVADLRYVTGVDEARWIDLLGNTLVEQGDTEDGGYLAPVADGGLALWPAWRTTTVRGWVIPDDALLDTTDFDMLALFYVSELGVTRYLGGKYNTNSNRREHLLYITSSDEVRVLVSDTGTGGSNETAIFSTMTALAPGWFAVRADYDETAGTVDFQEYDGLAVKAIVDSGGGIPEVVAALAPVTTDQTTFAAPITMNNDTASLSVGGGSNGASDDSLSSPYTAPLPWVQWIFDSTTVTFNPTRDGSLLATSFTDSDSGLDWVRQAVTPQSDWPTGEIFDGGDFLATSAQLSNTKTVGQVTLFADVTPDSASADGDRIISDESAASDGVHLDIQTGETVVRAAMGDGAADVTEDTPANLAAGTRAAVAAVYDTGTVAAFEPVGGLTAGASTTGLAGTVDHSTIEIGARPFDDSLPFNGSIHRVLIAESAFGEDLLNELAGVTAPEYATVTPDCANPGLFLTSNIDRTQAFAVLDAYDDFPTDVPYELAEATRERAIPIAGRDRPVVFRSAERSGVSFNRRVLVGARTATEVIGPEAYAELTAMVKDPALPYVCVRDADGNRHLANVRVPELTPLRLDGDIGSLYATIQVVETAIEPAPASA